jgi:hypothetical protein
MTSAQGSAIAHTIAMLGRYKKSVLFMRRRFEIEKLGEAVVAGFEALLMPVSLCCVA